MDWDSMTPNERIAAVATRVMGWKSYKDWWLTDDGEIIQHWNPLQDMNDAWRVVEKAQERHGWFEMTSPWRDCYRANFTGNQRDIRQGVHPGDVICCAALVCAESAEVRDESVSTDCSD
jgi:hypothetical protein